MQQWIKNFHNLPHEKNEKGNIELTKQDIITLQEMCNAIHTQARVEQFHSPQLQAIIAYFEILYFMD